MVKVKIESQYLVAEQDVKDKDLIHFVSEGEYLEGEFGEKLVIDVQTPRGENKKLSLNQTSKKNIMEEYGDDTEEWVSKPARVNIVKQMVGGKMKSIVYLTHPDKALNLEG